MGVFDVIPANSLEGLTSEDFRLLLNGVGSINVQTLISYTSFNDESGEYWTLADLLLLYLFGFEQNLVSSQSKRVAFNKFWFPIKLTCRFQ